MAQNNMCLTAGTIAVAAMISAVGRDVNGQTFEPLEPPEARSALETIVRQMRENYEHIRSWEGTYEYVHALKPVRENGQDGLPKTGQGERKTLLDFAIDLDGERTFLSIHRDATAEANRSTRGSSRYGNYVRESDTYFFAKVAGSGKAGSPVRKRAWKNSTTTAVGRAQWPTLSDPRMFFSFDGQLSYWERMTRILTRPDKIVGSPGDAASEQIYCLVERSVDSGRTIWRVTIEGPKDAAPGISQRFVFDEEAGCCCVAARQTRAGSLTHEQDTIYEKVAGVFVPGEITRRYYREDGSLKVSQVLRLKESKVNAELPAESFTLEALELQEGDELIDNTDKGRKFVYSEAGLIPAGE